MRVTKFNIEYIDIPIIGDEYRRFKLRIYTDTTGSLGFEIVLRDNDFTSLLDKLFDDAKYQIRELLKENEHE